MTTVGSSAAARSTVATSDVVVVLPCEPAMAMPYFTRISSASISARGITGMPRSARLAQLGVVARDRGREHDHVGAVHVGGRVRPRAHAAPSSVSRRVVSFCARSEPLTSKPCASSTSAMPLMPMPPMPTK